ncbi:hypothetical protein ACFQV2_14115 [Actinokineospora soli]|uniref:Uncharacterized protein n=1 Tax=Actinokineospora soli TaxID=1048753 RepID=A0ABW2TNW9_9PSEU
MTTRAPRTRPHPSWWITATTLAVLLVAACVVGGARPGNYVVLAWIDRPFLFGALALGLLALSCHLAITHPAARVALTAVLATAAIGWAALGAVAAGLADDLEELARHPNGDRVVVVHRGSNIIDPTWELRVRSGTGVATREWDLGCVNSDLDALTGVTWTGPTRLRVHLVDRHEDIAIDPATGRPDRTVEVGC